MIIKRISTGPGKEEITFDTDESAKEYMNKQRSRSERGCVRLSLHGNRVTVTHPAKLPSSCKE
jgi:hypothetical protein